MQFNYEKQQDILRRKIILAIGIITLVLGGLFTVNAYHRGEMVVATFDLLTTIAVVGVSFFFYKWGKVATGALLLAVITGLFFQYVIFRGFVQPYSAMWGLTYPVAVMFLLSSGRGLTLSLVFLVLAVLQFIIPAHILNHVQYNREFVIRFIGIYMVSTIVSYYWVRQTGRFQVTLERAINDREKSIKRYSDARQEVLAANRAKNEFLANISHEIRTPMNAIRGTAELIEKEGLNDKQQNLMRVFRNSSAVLLNLISDILDLSNIEAGRIQLNLKKINLHDLIEALAGAFSFRSEKTSVQFEHFIDETVPEYIVTDHNRLSQVLNNLLGNAFKFTEKGRVTLTLNVRSKLDDTMLLQFKIKDTGIGIDPEKQKAIFSRFYQADQNYQKQYRGTGLGLAIARELINLMGGEISVESIPGHGSEFSFYIRVKTVDGVLYHSNLNQDTSTVNFKQTVKALVVDDSQINRMLMKAMLGSGMFEVDFAEDGLQCLQLFEQKDYDIILMDIRMPNMDGVSATERIREIETQTKRPKTKIIAVTADALSYDRDRCLESGCDAYLPKPVSQATLLKEIQDLLVA